MTYVAQVNISSDSTVLNYMPLVVSSEFGKSAQFIIPVKNYWYIYTHKRKSFATVLHPCFIQYGPWDVLFSMVHVRIFITLQSYFCSGDGQDY